MRIYILFAMLLSSPVFAMTCADDLMVRVSQPLRLMDDRLLLEISYGEGSRTIEIPSYVERLAETPGLKAIVLAGNSGRSDEGLEYLETRHSLAYAFGDAFLNAHHVQSHIGPVEYPYRSTETVSVSYDDGTAREWRATFRTQPPFFRTRTGEIFFLPDQNVVVIKAIGDYNETGDFAVPILDLLGVSPKDTLLVHDDLGYPEGSLTIRREGPAKYEGNNAVLSMIRNLAYQAVRQAMPLIAPHVAPEKLSELVKAVRAAADDRDKFPIKHVDEMLVPYRSFVNKEIVKVRLAQLQPLRDELKEQRRPIGQLMQEFKDASPERKAELLTEKQRLEQNVLPAVREIERREQEIKDEGERLVQQVRQVLADRLSFHELNIGINDGSVPTGPGNGELKARYVLSEYPKRVFAPDLWEKADALLREWLNAPPVKSGGVWIRN